MKNDNWKSLLRKVDQLKLEGAKKLYDRVKIMVRLETSLGFKQNCEHQGKGIIEILDLKVNDTCCCYTELKHMLKLWPNANEWTDTRQMLITMTKQLASHLTNQVQFNDNDKGLSEEDSKCKMSHQHLSWKKEAIKLKEAYNILKAKYVQLQKEHNDLKRLVQRFIPKKKAS